MPHQCVRCSKIYEDGSEEILKGCSCGSKLFFYIRKEKLEEAKKFIEKDLSDKEKIQIEKDVLDIIGEKKDPDSPVILDLESIRILQPGKYELDLVHLFKNEPLIYKLEEGKYFIDVAKSFKNIKEKPEQPLKDVAKESNDSKDEKLL